eukprot:s158_g39.t1
MSFEMSAGGGDEFLEDDPFSESGLASFRNLAALENQNLDLEHSDSIRMEAVAAGMHPGPSNDGLGGEDLVEPFSELGQDSGLTFSGIPLSDHVSHAASSSHQMQVSESIEGYSAENVFGFARVGLQNNTIKQFWETGFWNDFLDPNKTFLSSFDANFKRPADPLSGVAVHDAGEVSERESKVHRTVKVAATFMDHVRDMSIMNWKDQRESEWQVSIHRWHSMLSTWSPTVKIVAQMFILTGFQSQAQLLVDIFYNRAPATLMKRCRSMSRMTNYFIDRGRAFPCDESQVYEFMCVERQHGAPASRLKGYIEAMTFCKHMLGVSAFDEATTSRRCQGVAALDVHYKVQQAEPLTVKQLEKLHKILFEDTELWNKAFAGMLLFCVYARARWSDAQHGEKFIEDMDDTGNCAYLEISTGVHKTAKALQLRHMYLPLVAPCVGAVEGNWGAEWCAVRRELGIHSLAEFPLMPAPNSELEPTVRPLTSGEAGSWMRDLLNVDTSNKQLRYSSHSLKATCLSYAAKRGINFEDRLSLGYHTHSLKMALVYSRDGASRPLRVLESLLKEVRLKVFNPNDTRSGRLSKLPEIYTENLDSVSIGSFEKVSPVNSESFQKTDDQPVCASDEPVLSDHATTGTDTESDAETTVRPKVSYKDIEAPEGTVLHQHVKLKTLQLMKVENRVVFLCGRKTSHMYKLAAVRHPFDTPKCRQCFHAKLD